MVAGQGTVTICGLPRLASYTPARLASRLVGPDLGPHTESQNGADPCSMLQGQVKGTESCSLESVAHGLTAVLLLVRPPPPPFEKGSPPCACEVLYLYFMSRSISQRPTLLPKGALGTGHDPSCHLSYGPWNMMSACFSACPLQTVFVGSKYFILALDCTFPSYI